MFEVIISAGMPGRCIPRRQEYLNRWNQLAEEETEVTEVILNFKTLPLVTALGNRIGLGQDWSRSKVLGFVANGVTFAVDVIEFVARRLRGARFISS